MLYVVLFEDNATLGADVRRRHMAAHLSFLEHNAARSKRRDRYARCQAMPPVGCGWSRPIAETSSMRS